MVYHLLVSVKTMKTSWLSSRSRMMKLFSFSISACKRSKQMKTKGWMVSLRKWVNISCLLAAWRTKSHMEGVCMRFLLIDFVVFKSWMETIQTFDLKIGVILTWCISFKSIDCQFYPFDLVKASIGCRIQERHFRYHKGVLTIVYAPVRLFG